MFTIAIVIGIVVLGGFGLSWLRVSHARRNIETRFESFRESVMELRQKVEAVRERHKLLPGSSEELKSPMTGATLALYTRVDEAARQLWDDWLKRMEVWDKLKEILQTRTVFRLGRLKEGKGLLDQLGSFAGVEKACADCVAALDRIEQGHRHAREMLEASRKRSAEMPAEIQSIQRISLPTNPYDAELAACELLIQRASQILPTDPVGSEDALVECQAKLEALTARIKDIVRLHHHAPKVFTLIEAAEAKVRGARSGGLLLVEPEGNPDPLLAQAKAKQGEGVDAIRQAAAQNAQLLLDGATKLAQDAEGLIGKQSEARDRCNQGLSARRAQAERLLQETQAATANRDELVNRFAPESWQEVANNLNGAEDSRRTADALVNEAAAASAPSVQHYFKAAGLLDRAQAKQEEAHSKLVALGQKLQFLKDLRQDCLRQSQALGQTAYGLEQFLAVHSSLIQAQGRQLTNAAQAQWRLLGDQLNSLRLNWPMLQQQLGALSQQFESARRAAEEDVRNHQKLSARLEEVTRESERIGYFLERRTEDRAKANELFRSAEQMLQEIRYQLVREQADWGLLLRRVEEAAANLAAAEREAQADMRISDQAVAQIDEAARQIDRARGVNPYADELSRAEAAIAEAKRLHEAQAYEQALAQANTARQHASQVQPPAPEPVFQQPQSLLSPGNEASAPIPDPVYEQPRNAEII